VADDLGDLADLLHEFGEVVGQDGLRTVASVT